MRKQFVFSILAIFLLSCENEEPFYSCDPVVDQWAKSHMSEIQRMDRSEFITIPISYQRAAFEIFTPEQRINIW